MERFLLYSGRGTVETLEATSEPRLGKDQGIEAGRALSRGLRAAKARRPAPLRRAALASTIACGAFASHRRRARLHPWPRLRFLRHLRGSPGDRVAAGGARAGSNRALAACSKSQTAPQVAAGVERERAEVWPISSYVTGSRVAEMRVSGVHSRHREVANDLVRFASCVPGPLRKKCRRSRLAAWLGHSRPL